jgi:sacsin
MHIVLKKSGDDGPVHILLTESDVTVFGEYDGNAIDVTQLPSSAGELLLKHGPAILNVNSLTNEKVIEYLRTSFNRFHLRLESSEIDVPDVVIDWLTLFWKWHGIWRYRSELFFSIGHFCLVPTSRNALVSPVHGVFDLSHQLDKSISEALEAVGISFLHPRIISGARLLLAEQGVIKSVTNGHEILDHISNDHAYDVKPNAANAFRNHLLSSLANSRRLGPLNEGQQRKLRRLPIYPIFVPPMLRTRGSVREIRPIADGQIIKVVVGISLIPILIPIIDDTAFLDGCGTLLDYLQGDGELLNADGVLSLAVDHMAQQPKHLQRAFVEHIVIDRDSVTFDLLRRLSAATFVAVCGDSVSARAPKDLFDPECAVATLLPNDNRLPCLSDEDDRAIVAGLQSLSLLRTTLTNDFIEERIAHISQYSWTQQSVNLARQLISLIIESNYDCSGLHIDPDWKWLPTKDGLLGSRKCHHRDAHPSELFDEVLPSLAVNKVSTSLVRALTWSELIPLGVIKGQLDKVLQHGQGYKKLHLIIQELSTRVDPSSQDKDDLRALISDRPWIPISRRCIVSTSHAVLSSNIDIPPGFHMVPLSLSDDHHIHQFLQLMGCSER